MKSFYRDLIIHTNQTFKKSIKVNRNISSFYSLATLFLALEINNPLIFYFDIQSDKRWKSRKNRDHDKLRERCAPR